MPELPEVETTRRGVAPHLVGRRVDAVCVRQPRLRWPVPAGLADDLPGQRLDAVDRRGKYLLFRFASGCLLLHLGMSGCLRVLSGEPPPGPHDHIDLRFGDRLLRFQDPRRFGSLHWTDAPPDQHPLLRYLGPEPTTAAFDGDYLAARAGGRRVAIKSLIMDSRVVVGVGNIYANESLFDAGIHPLRAAGRVSQRRLWRLADSIGRVIEEAIRAGGTTLRDFRQSDGRPGYFRHQLKVYGHGGQPCPNCGRALREIRLAQRSTVYCSRCQR